VPESLPKAALADQYITTLEKGNVLYFPNGHFRLTKSELALLNPLLVAKQRKNISYHPQKQKLSGSQATVSQQQLLQQMLQRYAAFAQQLVCCLLPEYQSELEVGRVSFRPVEISGRLSSSYRKDDTRLHIDAFPSTPVHGKRILRVFTNINPNQVARAWRLGESFDDVINYFSKKLQPPVFGSRRLLYWLKVTKTYRSLYDHYMLTLHDQMKYDLAYQNKAAAQKVQFSAGSSWIVFTDMTSHAVDHGQYALEQTFYVPVASMHDSDLSPLHKLQKKLSRKLCESV